MKTYYRNNMSLLKCIIGITGEILSSPSGHDDLLSMKIILFHNV